MHDDGRCQCAQGWRQLREGLRRGGLGVGGLGVKGLGVGGLGVGGLGVGGLGFYCRRVTYNFYER